jgi:hypothetical protein
MEPDLLMLNFEKESPREENPLPWVGMQYRANPAIQANP